jgi:hypothetical protein
MRARAVLWALVLGVAVLVAPGALTAVVRGGSGPVPEAEAESGSVRPGAAGDTSRTGAGDTPTSLAATGAVPAGTSPSGTGTRGGGRIGHCDPSCSGPGAVPQPPPYHFDPLAACTHRWQVEQSTGRLVDTGCASEPQTPVSVVVIEPPPVGPPVILPWQPPPTTTTTVSPPPPPPPTTAPPPPPPDPPTTDTTIPP